MTIHVRDDSRRTLCGLYVYRHRNGAWWQLLPTTDDYDDYTRPDLSAVPSIPHVAEPVGDQQ